MVVWSNASGGDINLDHVQVAVDAQGRAFFAARDLGGGRYFADCTAGGWAVGYAQLLCQ